MPRPRVGIWLVGAKGGVACTVNVGLIALKKGLVGDAGLVSQLPQFAALDLADWSDFVVGGHEIREGRLYDEALKLHSESHAIDLQMLTECKSELVKVDSNIRPGSILNVGPTIAKLANGARSSRGETPRQAIHRIQSDLKSFVRQNKLDHLIMVNVASTEPPLDDARLPERWAELDKLLDKPRKCPLAASSIYAISALDLGYSYINFTPSTGSAPAAICELARNRKTRHMGHDGKTGETLLKSALAPMFQHRNLRVMSWVGHNIFGNMDGRVLDDPANKKSKLTSKDHVLGNILGYAPQTHVSIEYIQSLGDWKTAWDHVHFSGFLGTPMTFQFTWQGCDSLLAAPLVLDLVRFTQRSWQRRDVGLMTFLASFFKSPLGVDEHDFNRQFQLLEAWAIAAQ